MAALPAYHYDNLAVQVPLSPASRPSVRVVPGRKRELNPPLSATAVRALKIGIACALVFMAISSVRVFLTSAAYGLASDSSILQSQIAEARSTGESLAVQESLLTNTANLRNAASSLGMAAAETSTRITLSADPVSIDSAGNLSLAGSVDRLAP